MANLLLVEDDASVRQIVMLQLSLVGYDVRAAEDAGQARRMMEEKSRIWRFWISCCPARTAFRWPKR
ncbi:MAG: hypothetical protein ACLR4A_13540 [Christensenellales bacterium]